MRLRVPPGVHRPVSDTWLLVAALAELEPRGRAVADLCAGSGAIAIAAAQLGAARVVAADVSFRAVLAARLNAAANGCRIEVRHGDMLGALDGERFDVIVANPPYVPAASDALPRHRATTPLDGCRDGRALIDRICAGAPAHLAPGGSLLIVHSSVCDEARTRAAMEQQGLSASVAARERGPLGPVLRARAPMLRERGLLGAEDVEEVVVVHGRAGV